MDVCTAKMEVPECPPTPPLLTEGLSSPKHDTEPEPTVPKEGSSSPRSGSPEPNCPICLGQLDNKSYSDSCFHKFCFKCLLEWSKVKAECPLCKQKFKSIIHNVKSMDEYDQYTVQPSVNERDRLFMLMDPWSMPPWFMRRQHQNAVRRHEHLPATVRQPGARPYFQLLNLLPSGSRPSSFLHHRERHTMPTRSNSGGLDRRQNIYRNNLWAHPLVDVTGRTRECSLEFYKRNVATTHRLLPWISRDLSVLCDPANIAVALERVNGLLTRHDMRSPEFSREIREFLGEHTRHFVHELISFARSPYDMMGYDREVLHSVWYSGLDTYPSTLGVEDSSSEDDIVEVPVTPDFSPPVSRFNLTSQSNNLRISSPVPGPSGVSFNISPSISLNSPLLVDDSDIDLDYQPSNENVEVSLSDVEVVAVLKPKNERTPEIVDLLSGSDSEPQVPPLTDSWDAPSTSWQGLINETTGTFDIDESVEQSSNNNSVTNVAQGSPSNLSVVSAEVSVPMKRKHKKSHKKYKRCMILSSDDDSDQASGQRKFKNCCCHSGEHNDKTTKFHRKAYSSSSSCADNDWSAASDEDSDSFTSNKRPAIKSKVVWKIHEASSRPSSDDEGPPRYPKIRSIVVKRHHEAQESGSSSCYAYSQQHKSDSESSWEPERKYKKKYSKTKDKGKGKGKGKKRSH